MATASVLYRSSINYVVQEVGTKVVFRNWMSTVWMSTTNRIVSQVKVRSNFIQLSVMSDRARGQSCLLLENTFYPC